MTLIRKSDDLAASIEAALQESERRKRDPVCREAWRREYWLLNKLRRAARRWAETASHEQRHRLADLDNAREQGTPVTARDCAAALIGPHEQAIETFWLLLLGTAIPSDEDVEYFVVNAVADCWAMQEGLAIEEGDECDVTL